MSHLRKILFGLALLAAGSYSTQAQHQRLGLAAQTIRLNADGTSSVVEAFCLDRNLYASREFVPYTTILNENPSAFAVYRDGSKIPLAEAMKNGLVTVEGSGGQTASGLGLKFASHKPGLERIEIAQPIGFGESPGGLISSDSAILKQLGTKLPNETAKQKNDRIWQAQAPERMLQELGFYPEGSVNPANTIAATKKFQESVGLSSTGVMDLSTSNHLKTANRDLTKRLNGIGFNGNHDSESKVKSSSDLLRDFQKYHDLPETGRVSEDVLKHLARDEVLAKQIQDLGHNRGPVSQILGGTQYPDVLTFFRDSKGVHALVSTGSKTDYWATDGAKVQRGIDLGTFSRLQFQHQFNDFVSQADKRSRGLVLSTDQVNDAELKKLESSSAITFPESITVVVSPFQQGRPVPNYSPSIPSATNIARTLRHYFGKDVPIFIAQDLETGLKNAAQMPKLVGPQGIKFFVDEKRIDDRDVVKNLSERLESLDIDVVEADSADLQGAAVGVVVGKNGQNMREALLRLARQGAFKDAILALAKCGDSDDVEFNGALIHASGAKGIMFYDEKIQPQAVKRVLVALTKRLSASGIPDGDWPRLFQLSVDDAAIGLSGTDLNEVLKLRNAHVQTSDLIRQDIFLSAESKNS
jgi:hypothetical protein